jgi:hypothetical protein
MRRGPVLALHERLPETRDHHQVGVVDLDVELDPESGWIMQKSLRSKLAELKRSLTP